MHTVDTGVCRVKFDRDHASELIDMSFLQKEGVVQLSPRAMQDAVDAEAKEAKEAEGDEFTAKNANKVADDAEDLTLAAEAEEEKKKQVQS